MNTFNSKFDIFNEKEITVIFDVNSVVCMILVDGVYNRKFVEEFLREFDDYELYDIHGKLNIKIADWLTENLPLFF